LRNYGIQAKFLNKRQKNAWTDFQTKWI